MSMYGQKQTERALRVIRLPCSPCRMGQSAHRMCHGSVKHASQRSVKKTKKG